jgi:hypothetical protein
MTNYVMRKFRIIALSSWGRMRQFWDVFVIPPEANGKNGSMTIRMRFKERTGKAVMHWCPCGACRL